MKILGIDPGTVVMGYGLVDNDGDNLTSLTYGAIRCPERLPLPERLCQLHNRLNQIIVRYEPDSVAIETPFVGENARSALAIGKAQGVAILTAALHHIPVFEYPPAAVKRHVADYGASSKSQVQEMVKLLLGLGETPQPHDAADALAIAICHSRENAINILEAQGK
jgi:crossover junction endodeoxyribonuclease RuvC